MADPGFVVTGGPTFVGIRLLGSLNSAGLIVDLVGDVVIGSSTQVDLPGDFPTLTLIFPH